MSRPCLFHRLAGQVLLLLLLVASGAISASAEEKAATFFVGRLKFANNNGNDCAGVGADLVKLVSRVTTVHVKEEVKVSLADENLRETPFLFMNGHNDFVLSAKELQTLREYLGQGGFLLASGCCTNPPFPIAWRREFSRIFPNDVVRRIPYDHLIYRAFYKIETIKGVKDGKQLYLEGLFHDGQLCAVMCEEGLCCSFAMDNNCNTGQGIAPDVGKKLAVNIAVYAMTH